MISSRRSFTLLELLVAMLILMILVGLAVPNFSGTYKKVLLRKSADDLADLMRYAQTKAILTQNLYQLKVEETAGTYWLNERKSDEKKKKTTYEPVPGWSGSTKRMPKEVVLKSEQASVLFHPDGTIDQIEIKLCDKTSCLLVSSAKRRGSVKVIAEAPG